MPDDAVGCAKPTGSVVGDTSSTDDSKAIEQSKEVPKMTIARVGAKAPDFTAPAYHKGGFINIKLSDYQGKWVLLCFYPGDFTFV